MMPIIVLMLMLLRTSDFSFWRLLTAIVFGIAAFTDFLDGYIARIVNAKTSFGRCFDVIADKILVLSILFVLVAKQEVLLIPSLIIVCREIIVSGLREFLAQKNVILHVSRLAKWKTAMQLVSIIFVILGKPFANIGNVILLIASLIAAFSMVDYIKQSLLIFDEL